LLTTGAEDDFARNVNAGTQAKALSKRAARGSGGPLTPSPPAEKPTARQDQAGEASTGDGAGDGSRIIRMVMVMVMVVLVAGDHRDAVDVEIAVEVGGGRDIEAAAQAVWEACIIRQRIEGVAERLRGIEHARQHAGTAEDEVVHRSVAGAYRDLVRN
jgi:hypothetical protein